MNRKPLAAIIIETRPLPNLPQVIVDHLSHLPKGVDLHLYVGEFNQYLSDLLTHWQKIVPEKSFRTFSHTIKNNFVLNDYNFLLTSSEFWEKYQNYERVLIFQHDSMILRPGIEEFLKWDYIGASWVWNPKYIGNGGLSLRNPETMLEITKRYPWNGQINEDHWLTMHMHEFKIGNLAPIEEADKFSIEAKYILGSLGYHAIDKWLTPPQCRDIRNQYIED